DNLEGDIVADPHFVGGHPYEYQLQANSPCIDAGDPDSPEDPDGTRADIGAYYYDQENGMPPAIISRHDSYTGWGMDFRYTARATDWEGAIELEFEGLPEWLEVEDDGRRDFVSDSTVVSGLVPNDQEDFVFVITARDEDGLEDTLSVQVFVYPMTVLTGRIGGVLTREDSPYVVCDTAWVAEDDSLVIEPGNRIFADILRFEDRYNVAGNIRVYGYLRAVGTEEDSIYFNALQDVSSGTVLYIRENREVESALSYCRFHGLHPFINGQSISITHCTFDSTGGISLSGSNVIIENNRLNNTGISVPEGRARIVNNRLTTTRRSYGISAGRTSDSDSILISQNRLKGFSTSIMAPGALFTFISENIIDSGSGENSKGIRMSNHNHIENGYTLAMNNFINNTGTGIRFEGTTFPKVAYNNLIDNASFAGAIGSFRSHPASVFANNVVVNSSLGFYLDNYFGDENDDYLRSVNNLFLNDSVLLRIKRPELNYWDFRFNAAFGFDSLGNEPNYVGVLSQVNANGDSCDMGFNIFLDPQIVNLDSLDFRLYQGSPLIDAGNPDSIFNDVDSTINDIGLFGGPFGESYEYPVGVGESDVPVPEGFTLSAPYPNPFNSQVQFTFNLPKPGDVEVKVYDVTGRLVFGKDIAGLAAGSHRLVWNGRDNTGRGLTTGIYYFELAFEGAKLVRPTAMIK
ncbi:MAG TPA: T9SS type A sorting domain-containing protein, partial [Bacteroidetes bacterium]|nr:T9SS type A sorting domain-containing protein [Bacteroidota bacterium]